MRITINGMPGSGKNTMAEFLAKKLNMSHYSMGDLRRKIAMARGMTIDELNKLGEKEAWTDKDADNYQKELGEKEDNFIIDGRLSWYFIPKSIKLFVKIDLEKAAERVFNAERKSEKAYKNPDEALKELKERIKSDVKRYRIYYGIKNVYDTKNYDIVIDTSYLTIKEMNKAVLDAVLAHKK